MSIKKGFTMTEILVALSIVGVLSAIMIPAFYRAKPNQEMLMLKKSYYMISRAISETINDEGFYKETNNPDESGFADTTENIEPYHGVKASGNTKFCELVAARMNVDGDVHCTANRTLADGGHFKTQDGAVWLLPISDFRNGQQEIWVDVNGSKGANCVASANCNKKPDRFKFTVDQWGKIGVNDELTKKYLSSTNSIATYKQIMEE